MSKKHIGIIAIVSVIFVCTASIGYIAYSGVWKDWVAGEWKNLYYRYEIMIKADEDLHNVTLYLPIPMKDENVSPLVNDIVNRFFEKNWTAEIIETEYGKMLKISQDIFTTGEYIGPHWGVFQKTDHIINTKNPVGNEPTLHPRVNITSNTFQSYIYAEYNSSDDAKLTISIMFRGDKSRTGIWGVTIGKYYSDEINYVTTGESDGWHLVNGTLEIKG